MSISIGPKGIELLLLQVDPGSEKRIASSLELQDPKKHHAHQVAKCFGKYDIIAIRRLDRNAHGLNLIDHRLLDKVLAVQQVLGFTWDTKNSRTVVDNLGAAPEDWVGVALVKLNPEVLFDKDGSAPIVNQFERGVIPIETALQKQRNLSSFLVTGTVGWFDLAVFMWGKDLRAIANSVVALRALPGNQPGRSKNPLLAFTWTAFGIDYSFVHGRRNWNRISNLRQRLESSWVFGVGVPSPLICSRCLSVASISRLPTSAFASVITNIQCTTDAPVSGLPARADPPARVLRH